MLPWIVLPSKWSQTDGMLFAGLGCRLQPRFGTAAEIVQGREQAQRVLILGDWFDQHMKRDGLCPDIQRAAVEFLRRLRFWSFSPPINSWRSWSICYLQLQNLDLCHQLFVIEWIVRLATHDAVLPTCCTLYMAVMAIRDRIKAVPFWFLRFFHVRRAELHTYPLQYFKATTIYHSIDGVCQLSPTRLVTYVGRGGGRSCMK